MIYHKQDICLHAVVQPFHSGCEINYKITSFSHAQILALHRVSHEFV